MVLGLIGGLFGGHLDRQHDKRQDAQNRQNFIEDREHAEQREDGKIGRLVKDAQDSGMSPLAAMGSSAAGPTGSPIMGQTKSGTNYADIGSQLGNTIQGRAATKIQQENAELQNDLLRAQINAVNADTVKTATSRTTAPTEAGTSEARANAAWETPTTSPQNDRLRRLSGDAAPRGASQKAVAEYLAREYITESGNRFVANVGADPGELASGWTMGILADVEDARLRKKMREAGRVSRSVLKRRETKRKGEAYRKRQQ